MKKLILSALLVLCVFAVSFANPPIQWKNNAVTTSYGELLAPDTFEGGYATIYNDSGSSYFIAYDASGTNEREISGEVTSFVLGDISPSYGTKRLFYVKGATSMTLTVFVGKIKR